MTASPKPILAGIALLISACCIPARAQDDNPAPAKPRRIQLSFLLLHEKYEGMDIYLAGAGDSDPIGPVHIHGSDFSESVAVLRDTYRLFATPPSNHPKSKGVLCVLNLSELKNHRVQVVLEPHGKRFRAHFVNPADKKFKANSTRFFNTTDVPIATNMGDVRAVVPAHGNLVCPPPLRTELPYYEVSFHYQEADGAPRKFESTRWPFRARCRNYTFFYLNPVTNVLSCKSVEEIVPSGSSE